MSSFQPESKINMAKKSTPVKSAEAGKKKPSATKPRKPAASKNQLLQLVPGRERYPHRRKSRKKHMRSIWKEYLKESLVILTVIGNKLWIFFKPRTIWIRRIIKDSNFRSRTIFLNDFPNRLQGGGVWVIALVLNHFNNFQCDSHIFSVTPFQG